MSEIYYVKAVCDAFTSEMKKDENVVLMGIDVKEGIWGTSFGLFDIFGSNRVINTPVCESSFSMAGVGAAMTGLRPIVELMFSEYVYLAMEAIANTAGQWGQVSNGEYKVPIVFQTFSGPRGHGAYGHSQSTQASLMNIPGIRMIAPSTPTTAKGLMISAIRSDDPVVVFHDRQILQLKEEVPNDDYIIPLDKARIAREGKDITIATFGGKVHSCLKAADELEKQGISVEVIDLISLLPLDEKTLFESLEKTSRLVCVESGRKRGGIGSEIAAVVAEKYIDILDAPIKRVAADNSAVPFSAPLERACFPDTESIVVAVKSCFVQ